MNEIGAGRATEQSLMDALGKGITESVIELMEPFASESIFTEALIDSTFRRGIGKGGRKVWQEEDDPFVKIGKGIIHIGESLTPGSIAQFIRLGQSAVGKSDKYGQTFDLKDELPGLFGFRSIQSNPERGLIYMTTRFTKGLDNAENLFAAPLLRGGRIDGQDIINRFSYSENRRFQVLKEMYQNIEAARKLGVSENVIRNKVKRKGLSKDVFNELMRGKYSPKRPSEFFIKRVGEINRELNVKEGVTLPNPYFEALPELNQIINRNRNISLLRDSLKVPEPVEQQITIAPRAQIQTPPLQTGELQPAVTTQQFANNIDPVTGLTFDQRFATLFPGDVTGQLAATRKGTKIG